VDALRTPYLSSRLGRRVVGLFILCALAPLALATFFLLREFDAQLTRNSEQELKSAVRGYGMALLGRLGSADDVLQALVSLPSASDESVQDEAARLPWVRTVRRLAPEATPRATAYALPEPDIQQQSALNKGEPAVLWRIDEAGNPQVYLVRRLPSGAWIYAEFVPLWLWADAKDQAPEATLLVVDALGQRIALGGDLPKQATNAAVTALVVSAIPHRGANASPVSAAPTGWVVQSWELFLGGRYATPSWRIIALRPRHSLIAYLNGASVTFPSIVGLTIALVSLLSIAMIRRQLRPLERLIAATKKVAQRDFSGVLETSYNDEFGDLARSFNAMSEDLQLQFSALETLSEIDRLLLRAPDLEQILDTLLPRVAAVLRCRSVSVLLIDPDAQVHARAYDFFAGRPGRRPVRRTAFDVAAIKAACEHSSCLEITAASADTDSFVQPLQESGATKFRLHPLRHDERFVGFLCIGSASDADRSLDPGIGASDFADRLSLILANLQRSEQLYQQAHFDPLTRLPNRQLFADRVNMALSRARETRGMGALLYIDLDQFKRVNDTAGHNAGDDLLRAVGQRLAGCINKGDSIARLGGDEFAILLPEITDADVARQVAERALAALSEPVIVARHAHHVAASIGVTVFPADGQTLEELLTTSDIAMYRAKESGRGQVVFFETEMQQRMHARIALETGLRRAMQREEFKLLYQPIVSAEARGSIGVEALIRWPNGPEGPGRSPVTFVPVAEESGLIIGLGEWVLRTACRQFIDWRREGVVVEYVSVNVSGRQLRHADLLEKILGTIASFGMEATQLQIEITESVLADGAATERTLREIAARGVRLALDDFGTGYSSLSYLRMYPIDTVKIDRSFVAELPGDVAACRLAESIIAMCGALGKQVIAEGVESEEQFKFLNAAGCNGMQGYFLGRPMEASDIPGFVRRLQSRTDLLRRGVLEDDSPRLAAG
jgi:diguanylate cyclase (GGDEF)-like protein